MQLCSSHLTKNQGRGGTKTHGKWNDTTHLWSTGYPQWFSGSYGTVQLALRPATSEARLKPRQATYHLSWFPNQKPKRMSWESPIFFNEKGSKHVQDKRTMMDRCVWYLILYDWYVYWDIFSCLCKRVWEPNLLIRRAKISQIVLQSSTNQDATFNFYLHVPVYAFIGKITYLTSIPCNTFSISVCINTNPYKKSIAY